MTEVHREYHQDEPVLSDTEYARMIRRFFSDRVVGKVATSPIHKIVDCSTGGR